MKPDICTFITARLDEEAAREEAATPGPWEVRDLSEDTDFPYIWVWKAKVEHWAGVAGMDRHHPDCVVAECSISDHDDGEAEKADAEFIAHTRNLAPGMIAALRAIVDLHRPEDADVRSPDGDFEALVVCRSCGVLWWNLEDVGGCDTLHRIAAIWAGHEDYQQEWRVG